MTPIQKFSLAIFLFVTGVYYADSQPCLRNLCRSVLCGAFAATIAWLIMSGLTTAIQGLR
jgi:hypothetical protein